MPTRMRSPPARTWTSGGSGSRRPRRDTSAPATGSIAGAATRTCTWSRPWWKFNFRRGHLTSDDALSLFERLDAKVFIPYHWGTFRHVTAGAHDAIVRLRAKLPEHARGHQVRIIEPGEAFELEHARTA